MISRNAILVGLILVLCNHNSPAMGKQDKTSNAQEDIAKISAALSNGNITSMEISGMDPDASALTAITPLLLEKYLSYKLTIRNIGLRPCFKDLTRSLKETVVHDGKQAPDVRLGVEFYTKDGVKAGSIYFDRTGALASLNGKSVTFDGSLFLCVKSICGASFRYKD